MHTTAYSFYCWRWQRYTRTRDVQPVLNPSIRWCHSCIVSMVNVPSAVSTKPSESIMRSRLSNGIGKTLFYWVSGLTLGKMLSNHETILSTQRCFWLMYSVCMPAPVCVCVLYNLSYTVNSRSTMVFFPYVVFICTEMDLKNKTNMWLKGKLPDLILRCNKICINM